MFFGGEPLIAHKEIKEICLKFSKLFLNKKILEIPKYGLVTNLTQCNPEIIDLIKTYDISLTASIDGPSYIHNLQRSNSYNIIKKNYKILKNNIHAIEATYTMNHVKQGISIQNLSEFLSNEFCIPINSIDVVPVTNCPSLEVDSISNKEMLQESEFNTEDGFIFAAFDFSKQSDLFCNAGCNRICITVNGDIYPCQTYVNYTNTNLGNINNLDLNKYMSVLEKLPSRIRCKGKCALCWARKFCKICPAQAINNYNIFSSEKCAERISNYENLLKYCVTDKKSSVK